MKEMKNMPLSRFLTLFRSCLFVNAILFRWYATEAASCPWERTPSDLLGPFYAGTYPLTQMIGPMELLSNASHRLEVSGHVFRSTSSDTRHNCSQPQGVSDVEIHIWYAGEPDVHGNFYRTDEYRGRTVTNACGEYSFTQTFPALYPTRPILHNHYRLSREGKELLVTQMYFVGTERGYVRREQRMLQAAEILTDVDGTRHVRFDIYVDVPGDCVTCDMVECHTGGDRPLEEGGTSLTTDPPLDESNGESKELDTISPDQDEPSSERGDSPPFDKVAYPTTDNEGTTTGETANDILPEEDNREPPTTTSPARSHSIKCGETAMFLMLLLVCSLSLLVGQ